MAAPHVAAAAALVKTALPDATSSKIGSLLTESSDDLGDAGWDEKYGSDKDSSGKPLSMQTPVNGTVSFTGLSSSTSYQLVACNDNGGSSGKKSSGSKNRVPSNEKKSVCTKLSCGIYKGIIQKS